MKQFTFLHIFVTWWTITMLGFIVSSTVLDPSLYLGPRPPLRSSRDSMSPTNRWSLTSEARINSDSKESAHSKIYESETTTETLETMERTDTLWPKMFTPEYGFGGIHIPLTFALTGNYGGNSPGMMTGLIGSSYISINNDNDQEKYRNYRVPLTGISYGSGYPKTRIYGGFSRPAWSGWGNGKWGHYGKG